MTNHTRYPGLGMGPIGRAFRQAATDIEPDQEPPDTERPWFDDELLEEKG
jgi:hypothetical protein